MVDSQSLMPGPRTPQEAVEQQAAAAAEVRAAAAEVRAAAAAPVTLADEQWGLLGRRLAALQSDLQVAAASCPFVIHQSL